MADLTGKLGQQGESVMYNEAISYLTVLNSKMTAAATDSITPIEGYISKYEYVDGLRNSLQPSFGFEGENVPEEVKPLLDPLMTIKTISETGDNFKTLQDYVAGLDGGSFDPPLAASFSPESSIRSTVHPVPSKEATDPRRFGRLIMFNDFNASQQEFLINNAPLYGFVLYENYGLYFLGFQSVKDSISTNGLQKTLSQFQKNLIPATSIVVTATAILSAEDPIGLPLDPVTYPDNVKNNEGVHIPLVRTDMQTIWAEVFPSYKQMYAAAKAAGHTLRNDSGFRPAFGAQASWTSTSGKTNTFTTQETLRNQSSRWWSNGKLLKPNNDDIKKFLNTDGTFKSVTVSGKTGKQAFVFHAGSKAFSPATAPPGASRHGSGIACDFPTGTLGSQNISEDSNSPAEKLKSNGTYYKWLVENSWKYGFIRTVGSEEWHFDWLPERALKGPYSALKNKQYNLFYAQLGLGNIPGGTLNGTGNAKRS
tara:strand:- start:374 stop:1813 length:1440 start_codon:yes stop_codon:yes gene_type:complete